MRLQDGSTRRASRHENAIALIIVLAVMTLLSIMVMAFGQSMRTELKVASSYGDRLKALELAKSGVQRAIADLLADTTEYDDTQDAFYDSETEYKEVELGEGTYSLLNIRYEQDEEVSFGLIDEGAKLNLNTATQEMLVKLLEQFPATQDLAESLAGAIVDWRDQDEEDSPQGAESAYYESLTPGYYCKSAAFETVEELLLVADFDEEMLYGEDTNRNGVLDPNEKDGDENPPNDNGDDKLDRGLIDFVTVYTKPPTSQEQEGGAGGSPGPQASNTIPVNINVAPLEVIKTLPGVDEDLAHKIDDYRATTAESLENKTWLRAVDGVTAQVYSQLESYVATRSDQFTVQAIGKLAGKPVFRRIVTVLDRSGGQVQILYWRELTHLGPPYAFEDQVVDDR